MDEKTKQTTKNPNRVRGGRSVADQMVQRAGEVKADVQTACKPKVGQPTKFTQELWEEVLEYVATYGDLVEICARSDMPAVSTVRR